MSGRPSAGSARIQANVDAMTRTALELWRRGHLPVMGKDPFLSLDGVPAP